MRLPGRWPLRVDAPSCLACLILFLTGAVLSVIAIAGLIYIVEAIA